MESLETNGAASSLDKNGLRKIILQLEEIR